MTPEAIQKKRNEAVEKEADKLVPVVSGWLQEVIAELHGPISEGYCVVQKFRYSGSSLSDQVAGALFCKKEIDELWKVIVGKIQNQELMPVFSCKGVIDKRSVVVSVSARKYPDAR